MNEIKLTTDIEFTNEYEDARKKLYDFMAAMNKLTPEQSQQLARECMAATGTAALFQQFINYMNFRGYR